MVSRGPYMHNGALATLEQVMHHYELLAAGERRPLVGKLAFYVRYKGIRLTRDSWNTTIVTQNARKACPWRSRLQGSETLMLQSVPP